MLRVRRSHYPRGHEGQAFGEVQNASEMELDRNITQLKWRLLLQKRNGKVSNLANYWEDVLNFLTRDVASRNRHHIVTLKKQILNLLFTFPDKETFRRTPLLYTFLGCTRMSILKGVKQIFRFIAREQHQIQHHGVFIYLYILGLSSCSTELCLPGVSHLLFNRRDS